MVTDRRRARNRARGRMLDPFPAFVSNTDV